MTRAILLLVAAFLCVSLASTAAMQLFPMASHPEVDACVDAEADERRQIQHDHCDMGGVSTCGVDDPVGDRDVRRRRPMHWPDVAVAVRRSVRDTARRARDGLGRAVARAKHATEKATERNTDEDNDDADHHAAQRDTLASIVDTLEDIERQLFLVSPSTRAARRAPQPLAALRDRFHSWLGRGPPISSPRHHDGNPQEGDASVKPSGSGSLSLVDWQRDLLFRSAVDVKETDDAYVLHADVPGLGDEDLHVELDDVARTLTVFGRRDDSTSEEEKNEEKNTPAADSDADADPPPATHATMYHARERHFGAFENTYQLPHDADASRVNADVKRGVLTVTVPKSKSKSGTEVKRPRRVAVTRE